MYNSTQPFLLLRLSYVCHNTFYKNCYKLWLRMYETFHSFVAHQCADSPLYILLSVVCLFISPEVFYSYIKINVFTLRYIKCKYIKTFS